MLIWDDKSQFHSESTSHGRVSKSIQSRGIPDSGNIYFPYLFIQSVYKSEYSQPPLFISRWELVAHILET